MGSMDKTALRKKFRLIRHQISERDAENWSAQMADDLNHRLRKSRFDGVVFLFSPTRGEPDVLRFFRQVRFHVALPKVEGAGHMNFYLWTPGDPLLEGAFGILEPSDQSIMLMPRAGDVAVIPALAVDLKGRRLGAGGGYYDRWLAEHREKLLFTAAAVFPPCVFNDPLPADPYDQSVDLCLASH